MKNYINKLLVLAAIVVGIIIASSSANAADSSTITGVVSGDANINNVTTANDNSDKPSDKSAKTISAPLVIASNTTDKKSDAGATNANANANSNENNVVINNTNNNKQEQKLDVKVSIKESDIKKIVEKEIAKKKAPAKKLPATGGSGAVAISSIIALSGSAVFGAKRIFGIFSK